MSPASGCPSALTVFPSVRVRFEGHPLAGLSLQRSTATALERRKGGGQVFLETVIVGNFDE